MLYEKIGSKLGLNIHIQIQILTRFGRIFKIILYQVNLTNQISCPTFGNSSLTYDEYQLKLNKFCTFYKIRFFMYSCQKERDSFIKYSFQKKKNIYVF